MSAPAHRRKTTPQSHWQTPRDLFRAANAEFDFTLDGAASPANALVDRYLSLSPEHDHGRNFGNAFAFVKNERYSVRGERVFLNPPYGVALGKWVRWCADMAARGALVFAVLPVSTASWFNTIWQTADEVRVTTQRPQFIHPPGCECKACEAGEKGSSTLDIWFVVWRGAPRFDGWLVQPPRFSLWEYPRDTA